MKLLRKKITPFNSKVLMSIRFFIFILFFHSINVFAQKNLSDPFIKLTEPLKEKNITSESRRFIIGSTCKACLLTINNNPVKVFPTGAFAYEINLYEGDTSFYLQSISQNGKKTSKTIQYGFRLPSPEKSTQDFIIEKIQTFPEGDLWLKPGDAISFRVKALSGMRVSVMNNTTLFEMPDSVTNGIKGIYQGKYIIQPSDSFVNKKIQVTLTDSLKKYITKETSSSFTVMNSNMSDVVLTTGRLAHLEYGLGDDRLGGAKIGYLDSLIPLKVIGKVGSDYKIKLAPSRTAYISDSSVVFLPPGTFSPSSLTGKIRTYGDSVYDYVAIQLFHKLPYQSFQLTDPSKIVVDIFGATNNTNWIDQPLSAIEIKKTEYEQIADDIFRVTISLNHQQHWGHKIFYEGNNLVVRVKHQPKSLALKDLTIAVDAGHGGKNTGAGGPTGISEKELTLQLSLRLMKALKEEGARVIMTRTEEKYFDNKERILFYRDSTPDILLSLHLNSSNDPINISGTSTFYRYIGFRPLSLAIYKRMLELGLKEYGNNGSFNFMLNSPTEYPNALIETLFLSNPEEEMKILDEEFQDKMVNKIVEGLKDFLSQCKL